MKSILLRILDPLYVAIFNHMVRLGLILRCSDSPDMGGVNRAAEANAEVAKLQLEFGKQEAEINRKRQAEFDPIYKKILQSSLEQQDLSSAQSAAQWQSYRDTWQPVEAKLAKTAMEFDTPQRRESEAAAAGADVGIQYGAQQQALERDLARSNTSLSSGKALAMRSGMALAQAKDTAAAQNTARRQVEQAGTALVDNAARFGRNMTSTGIETARLSLGAGQSGSSTMAGQQSTANQGLSGVQSWYQGAVGANNSAGNLLLGAANVEQQANAANQSMIGGLVGAGLGAYALKSTEKSKNVEGDVDPDAALTSVVDTPVKAWRYKDGEGDSRLRLGPMAEAVAASTGVGDGKTLDIATELGVLRASVQALAKRQLADGKKESRGKRARLTLADMEA